MYYYYYYYHHCYYYYYYCYYYYCYYDYRLLSVLSSLLLLLLVLLLFVFSFSYHILIYCYYYFVDAQISSSLEALEEMRLKVQEKERTAALAEKENQRRADDDLKLAKIRFQEVEPLGEKG